MFLTAKLSLMQDAKNKFAKLQEDIVAYNRAMLDTVDAVKESWNSESGNAMQEGYASVNAIFLRMSNTLNDGCNALQVAINEYTATENANTNILKATYGDITQPL